jgi:hypothetical protein
MPCVTYDDLLKKWSIAIHEENRASDPDDSTVRGMSSSRRLSWKSYSRRAVQSAEHYLNAHISGCAICKEEGNKPLDTSQGRE